MNRLNTRQLAIGGLIAALYIALGVAFAPISFGSIQVRIAELLTLMPLFTPYSIWGLTVGCAITNLYGMLSGASILGVYDIVLGSAATFAAALLTYRLRNVTFKGLPVAATLPPVFINALVVGAELTVVMSAQGFDPAIFAFNFTTVALGQLAPCVLLGLPLVSFLQRSGIAQKVFGQHETANLH